MERKKIMERAANLFTNEIAKSVFIEGAEWRINSVWHRADEKPEDGRIVLATTDLCIQGLCRPLGGFPVICGPNNEEWDETAEDLCIKGWAYVDDLLPDTFDEILEANKDV